MRQRFPNELTAGITAMMSANERIPLVILESPYAGEVEANLAYARRCAFDCAMLGEATIASHLHYTQFLDDKVPEQRTMGIRLGLAWRRVADYSVFYTDRGWSRGMLAAAEAAQKARAKLYIRSLTNEINLPPLDALVGPELIAQSIERTWTP